MTPIYHHDCLFVAKAVVKTKVNTMKYSEDMAFFAKAYVVKKKHQQKNLLSPVSSTI